MQVIDEQHSHIRAHLDGFDALVFATADAHRERVSGLSRFLGKLHQLLTTHFQTEESSDFFRHTSDLGAEISASLETLKLEHAELLAMIQRLRAACDNLTQLAQVETITADVHRLIERLRQHERREGELAVRIFATH